MQGLKLFRIFLALFLLGNGVISQNPTTPLEDLRMSETNLERQQPKTQLLELNSNLESLFTIVSVIGTSLKIIKRLLRTTEETLGTHLGHRSPAGNSLSADLHFRKYDNSSARRKDVLEKLLKDPKATVFRGENMTGEAVNYDSSNTTFPGGCQIEWDGIKSMRISESCVRVFKGGFCDGISRALYPKPNSRSFINFLTPELSFVRSVGPCLPNEFQFATVSRIRSRIAVTKVESNVYQVPDFVDFSGGDTFGSKSTLISSSTNPVGYYYMDQDRAKWLLAWIFKRHLKIHTGSNSGMNVAIPPELGGPTKEVYNTFNQTRKNFEEWKRITDQVFDYLGQLSNGRVWITVTFVYDAPLATNPYGFYYWIKVDSQKIMYGFIEN